MLPEFAPNRTDSCGSSRGDSSNQAFVIHRVWVGVFVELLVAWPRLPLLSLFENRKGTAAPKCYGVIAMLYPLRVPIYACTHMVYIGVSTSSSHVRMRPSLWSVRYCASLSYNAKESEPHRMERRLSVWVMNNVPTSNTISPLSPRTSVFHYADA
jgi:hypothetical protein